MPGNSTYANIKVFLPSVWSIAFIFVLLAWRGDGVVSIWDRHSRSVLTGCCHAAVCYLELTANGIFNLHQHYCHQFLSRINGIAACVGLLIKVVTKMELTFPLNYGIWKCDSFWNVILWQLIRENRKVYIAGFVSVSHVIHRLHFLFFRMS